MRDTRIATGLPSLSESASQLAGLKRPTNVNLPIRRYTGRPGEKMVIMTDVTFLRFHRSPPLWIVKDPKR
jgi:hypothetical protein